MTPLLKPNRQANRKSVEVAVKNNVSSFAVGTFVSAAPPAQTAFGIQTRFEGVARYLPLCTRSWRADKFASTFSPYCTHVTPSTPGAAFDFCSLYASRSRSTVMWCIRLLNRMLLFFPAASRILSSPLNASPCPCVQFAVVFPEFPSVTGLPSSVFAASPLVLFDAFFSITPAGGFDKLDGQVGYQTYQVVYLLGVLEHGRDEIGRRPD